MAGTQGGASSGSIRLSSAISPPPATSDDMGLYGIRVVDQTDHDRPGQAGAASGCMCGKVQFQRCLLSEIRPKQWGNDQCICGLPQGNVYNLELLMNVLFHSLQGTGGPETEASRYHAAIVSLYFSMGGKDSDSGRPSETKGLLEAWERLLLIKAVCAGLKWLRGQLLGILSFSLLGLSVLVRYEKCFLLSTSSIISCEREIYSTFKGSGLNCGQTAPALPASLDVLLLCLAHCSHPAPRPILHRFPSCSVPREAM